MLLSNCVCVCVCVSNMLHKCISLPGGLADSARDVSGCVFQSPRSLGVPTTVFCSISAVWTVSHTCQALPYTTAAGWVHTLAINLSLLCALMGVCVDTC